MHSDSPTGAKTSTHTQDGPKRKLMEIDSCMESVRSHVSKFALWAIFGPKLAVGGTTSYGPIYVVVILCSSSYNVAATNF